MYTVSHLYQYFDHVTWIYLLFVHLVCLDGTGYVQKL